MTFIIPQKNTKVAKQGITLSRLGITITQYAKEKKISKSKVRRHRSGNSSNFPKPVDIAGGMRKIHYYNKKDLDAYFAATKDSVKSSTRKTQLVDRTLLNTFITTNWKC